MEANPRVAKKHGRLCVLFFLALSGNFSMSQLLAQETGISAAGITFCLFQV